MALGRFSLDIWQAVHSKLVKAAGVFEFCFNVHARQQDSEWLKAMGMTREFCASMAKGSIASAEELQLAVALGQIREEHDSSILATRLLACAIHERWKEAESHKEDNTFAPGRSDVDIDAFTAPIHCWCCCSLTKQ